MIKTLTNVKHLPWQPQSASSHHQERPGRHEAAPQGAETEQQWSEGSEGWPAAPETRAPSQRGGYTREDGKLTNFGQLEETFVCFGFLTFSSTTWLYRGQVPRQSVLTILHAATHEIELGDHDFCLSRSHYTDTDPTSRERAATAGIEPRTSSPGVARSTD